MTFSTITLPSSQLPLPARTQPTRPPRLLSLTSGRFSRPPWIMPSCHLVFCPPPYFVIDEPSPARQRLDSAGIIGFEYRDGPPPRLMLVTKHGKASLHSHSASVRTFLSSVTLSDVRLPISSSRSCTCSGDKHTLRSPDKFPTSPVRFPHVHGLYLWDDNARLHSYSNRHVCLFFTSKHADQYRRRHSERKSNWKHCSGRQRVRDERG
jgi:hypothetical protein